jgi:hypothetical protein
MIVFKKEYYGESLVDLDRDISEMYDDHRFEQIPVDEHGLHKGTFTVTVTWENEE